MEYIKNIEELCGKADNPGLGMPRSQLISFKNLKISFSTIREKN